MRIFITGATGMIGSMLVRRLSGDNQVHELRRSRRLMPWAGTHIHYGDIRELDSVADALYDSKPEIVVHLAAQSSVPGSSIVPQTDAMTNYVGAFNLLEAARRCASVRHVIIASSSEVYGETPETGAIETDRLEPRSPYGISKCGAEAWANFMRLTASMNITVTRPFSTYGRSHVPRTDNIIDSMCFQALTTGEIKLYGGSPVRDFLYLEDHVDAYLAIIETLARPSGSLVIPDHEHDRELDGEGVAIEKRSWTADMGAVNICTGTGFSVDFAAGTVARLMEEQQFGMRSWISRTEAPDRPLLTQTVVGCPDKMIRETGWRAKVGLEEGIARTLHRWKRVIKESGIIG